jgi:hypothetical protein
MQAHLWYLSYAFKPFQKYKYFDLDKVYSLHFGPIDLGHYGISNSQFGEFKVRVHLGILKNASFSLPQG